MPIVLLASENQGKLVEMLDLLRDVPVDVVTPQTLGLQMKVPETGSNYAENAALKAVAYARASGLLALGDDTGLEVDALEGRPGLYSARFAPMPNATDRDRRQYLLEQLQGKPRPWTAHFHCTVAVANPRGEVRFAEGEVYGEIIPEERGTTGFGYDPIFLISDFGQTMAELGMEIKNQISHRARAVPAAVPLLEEMLSRSAE